MQRPCNRDCNREFRALGRIEVEEKIVRMVQIFIAAGPRIVIDAAEAGQKQKRSAVISGGVVNLLPAFFGIDGHSLEPVRQAFTPVFLEESLPLDSVGK